MGKWEKLYVTHMAKDFCLYKVLFQIEKKFKTYQRAKWHRQKIHPREIQRKYLKKKINPNHREMQIEIRCNFYPSFY